MPKVGEHLRIRTDEEIEAKKQRERRWTFVLLAAIVGAVLLVAVMESTPEARRTNAEKNANAEHRQKVEAEAEKTYKLFKEAEELQKMRPLNAVEEKVLRDQSRRAAEEKVSR